MFELDTLIAGIFFSIIGFYAWRYGRQNNSARHMLLGVGLMAYGYFIPNIWLCLLLGGIMTLFLFWP